MKAWKVREASRGRVGGGRGMKFGKIVEFGVFARKKVRFGRGGVYGLQWFQRECWWSPRLMEVVGERKKIILWDAPNKYFLSIPEFAVYDSDCNGKVTFHDMLRALRDLSGPFMSDQQREEVLTQVLEEAGYAKDCSLVLSDFMKILGNSGLKMEVEVPVD
ncbi:hypothetical protein JHK85_005087 [Glycine max]|nr:hypothetical protein JHK85_005087 [Glycine max]